MLSSCYEYAADRAVRGAGLGTLTWGSTGVPRGSGGFGGGGVFPGGWGLWEQGCESTPCAHPCPAVGGPVVAAPVECCLWNSLLVTCCLPPPAAESRDALESPKEPEKPDPGENPQEADTWNGPGEWCGVSHPAPSQCPDWICWSSPPEFTSSCKHQCEEDWAGCKPLLEGSSEMMVVMVVIPGLPRVLL